jgi:hypothetical protein
MLSRVVGPCQLWSSGKSIRISGDQARLLVLLLLAVVVRLLYVHSMPTGSQIGSTDAWGYHRLALNLEQGNGFSLRRQSPHLPDSIRTPLYPLFLVLIRRTLGVDPQTAARVQAILDSFTTLLVYWLAWLTVRSREPPSARVEGKMWSNALYRARLTQARRCGRIAALLYALNPTQIRYTNELLTETLLSLLLTLCLCILVQYIRATPIPHLQNAEYAYATSSTHCGTRTTRYALLLGLLGALATLTKPNVQFLPLVWLLAMLLAHGRDWRHAMRDVAAMLTVLIVTLAPWIVRNASLFGRPFLSTAFEGNVSRVSAPATMITVRNEYAIPWSTQWESAFSEIVSQAADRYRWNMPWEELSARELDTANRQVYLVARQILYQYPLAWLASHLQGLVRHLEPQIYRVLYARFTGQVWPPDILDDALIHVLRAMARRDWRTVTEIFAQERWLKLNALQREMWWAMVVAQLITSGLMLLGAWRLRHRLALSLALLGTITYVLWLPGPIAYERFRVPVLGLILALVAVSTAQPVQSKAMSLAPPDGPCYNRPHLASDERRPTSSVDYAHVERRSAVGG